MTTSATGTDLPFIPAPRTIPPQCQHDDHPEYEHESDRHHDHQRACVSHGLSKMNA